MDFLEFVELTEKLCCKCSNGIRARPLATNCLCKEVVADSRWKCFILDLAFVKLVSYG